MSKILEAMRQHPAITMTFYGVILAGIIAFIAINNSTREVSAPLPTVTPGDAIQPSGGAEPSVSPSEEVHEEENYTEDEHNDEADEHNHHDVDTDLSDADQEAAMNSVLNGLENYFAVGSKESVDERASRIAKYFPEGSPYLTSDDSLLLIGDGDNEEITIEQSGVIQWVNPESGKDGEVSMLASLYVQARFVADDTGESQTLEGYVVMNVTTAKQEDGTWRITEMVEG